MHKPAPACACQLGKCDDATRSVPREFRGPKARLCSGRAFEYDALVPDLLDLLLRRGWLPRELPPCFSTESFADLVAGGNIPTEQPRDMPDAELCVHSMPRYRNLRRDLALVHPRAQLGLCRDVAGNWQDLKRHCEASPVSASAPVLETHGRAIERRVPRTSLGEARAINRSGGRYLLRADVVRFYGSIYTHSIPWALHTKTTAKNDRSDRLLGNRLDAWVRKGQSGQTLGIPIGPDTSLLLAEVILSAVDVHVAASRPQLQALRYMDDFEIIVGSQSEGTEIQVLLETALAEYELSLNASKTKVERLPQSLQRPWATALRQHSMALREEADETDFVGFFSAAFELAVQFESEPVLNFALACIRRSTKPRPIRVRKVLDALMLQAMVAEPGTHRYVLDHFTSNATTDKSRLTKILVEHIRENARASHMNEVAWALWAIISLRLHVGRRLAGTIEHLKNDVVALLALTAQREGLIDGLDPTRWRSIVTEGALYGPHWLLTYEALASGLLSTSDGSDPLKGDAFFSAMRQQEVSFLQVPTDDWADLKDEEEDEDDNGHWDDDEDQDDDEDDDDGLFEPEAAWEDAYSP